MSLPKTALIAKEVPRPLRGMVAPMVRWAFGCALGVLGAAALGLFALYHAQVAPDADGAYGIALVGRNYLPGYAATLPGAAIGAAWGFLLGFVAGWSLAFVRNTMLSVLVHLIAWRQRLAADAHVLDDL